MKEIFSATKFSDYSMYNTSSYLRFVLAVVRPEKYGNYVLERLTEVQYLFTKRNRC